MNNSLFVLDREKSLVSNNIFIYRYLRWISKDKARYPLYVAFTRTGVMFCLSSIDLNADNKKIRYSSTVMLLPLSLDSNNICTLSSTLNSAYLENRSENFLKEFQDLEVAKQYEDVESYRFETIVESISRMRLLLDFLYEFEHGKLFRRDPFFKTTYTELHKHHLFNSIVNKLEYLYASSRYESSVGEERVIELGFLAETERRWVENIINPQSEMVFHESQWFKEKEDVGELNYVYDKGFTLDEVRTLAEIRNNDPNADTSVREVIKGSARLAANWYMSKYRLDGILKILLGEKSRFAVCGMSLSVILLAVLSIVYGMVYENIENSCFWRSFFLVISLLLGVSGVISCAIPAMLKKSRWKLCGVEVFTNLFMPRLFAAIAAGWMTVGLSDLVAEGDHSYPDYAVIAMLVISIILLLFIWLSVRKIHPYARPKAQFLISVILLAISTIYSMLMGAFLLDIYSGRSYFFGCNVEITAPKTLLVFAFISMFVGIFIQMLFNGKSISSVEN